MSVAIQANRKKIEINKGIRINALAPGLVNTAMTKAWFDDPNMNAHFIANTPIGRVSEPAE